MGNIEHYTQELELGYRLISYLIRCFRRFFESEIEKRAREIVALETPRIYWTGFATGALVVGLLVLVVFSSRQSLS
jgi:hypothetical protein